LRSYTHAPDERSGWDDGPVAQPNRVVGRLSDRAFGAYVDPPAPKYPVGRPDRLSASPGNTRSAVSMSSHLGSWPASRGWFRASSAVMRAPWAATSVPV